ncbi:unnamed protein product [Cuscuta epithymum]|uniref:Trichome birefringence-like C-terminal domain-containing protein n=1 Tax=Cuscuta epithymum TaxID=186058 RepID=A0AAV0CWS4_9ASTE|nr:unnamed protein product [Cuscuta epithymum]
MKQPSSYFSFFAPSLFLCLLCIAALFFSFFLLKSSPSSPQNNSRTNQEPLFSPFCNVSHGRWIYDPTFKSPRYDNTCKDGIALGGNNTMRYNLPQFNALQFLDRFRNTNIGFISDSLNRNIKHVCLLVLYFKRSVW